jgi:hypothetical protein
VSAPKRLPLLSVFFADSRILPEAHSLHSVQGIIAAEALAEGPLLAGCTLSGTAGR